MCDLSLPTIEDIVQELRRRKLNFGLYLDLTGQYRRGGDLPSEKRADVYAYGSEENPAWLAGNFCNGIQIALDKVVEHQSLTSLVVALSAQANLLKAGLWELAAFIDSTLGE